MLERNEKINIISFKNIEDMYGYCGYLSNDGTFYPERKLGERSIEHELWTYTFLKYLETLDTTDELKKKKLSYLISRILGGDNNLIINKWNFVYLAPASDETSVHAVLPKKGLFKEANPISPVQLQVINELQQYYKNKNYNLKRTR